MTIISKFDIEKFRKVHALIGKGATVGERAAAQAKAETLAGMTDTAV
jgi:hypothetical protein